MEDEHYHAGRYYQGQESERAFLCFNCWANAANFILSDMMEYAEEEDDLMRPFDEASPTFAYVDDSYWADHPRPVMASEAMTVLIDRPPQELDDFTAIIPDNYGRKVVFWLKQTACVHQ